MIGYAASPVASRACCNGRLFNGRLSLTRAGTRQLARSVCAMPPTKNKVVRRALKGEFGNFLRRLVPLCLNQAAQSTQPTRGILLRYEPHLEQSFYAAEANPCINSTGQRYLSGFSCFFNHLVVENDRIVKRDHIGSSLCLPLSFKAQWLPWQSQYNETVIARKELLSLEIFANEPPMYVLWFSINELRELLLSAYAVYQLAVERLLYLQLGLGLPTTAMCRLMGRAHCLVELVLLLQQLGYRWESPFDMICNGANRFVKLKSQFDGW